MRLKIFRVPLCVLFVFSMFWITGCEKVENVVTDSIVSPVDTESMLTLKVGLLHPQPNYTSFGKGAILAKDELNTNGGVLGMQVELIFREETTDTVVQSTRDLIENENVVAILGPLFSSHAVRVGPVTSVPTLLGATRAEVTGEETDPNDLMFLIAGSNVLQAELLAKVVNEDLKKKTAAMIWQDKDVYSEGFVESFETNFTDLGGSIVEKQQYEGTTTVFDAQLDAIKVADPDVLLLASFPPHNPNIMKQARDKGITATFIGSDGWDDPLMFTTLDDNSPLDDSYYCTNLDPTAMDFISSYEMVYGSVDGIAATGYDALKILAMAINTVGSVDDPVALRDAIAAITDFKGATTILRFDGNRNPVKSVGVRKIQNGMPQMDIIVTIPE